MEEKKALSEKAAREASERMQMQANAARQSSEVIP